MVRIRLQRTGRKNLPSYRIVAADSHAKRDGKFIELLGHYKPIGKKEFKINQVKYNYWIEKGAQPSDTVQRLVKSNR